MGEGGELWARGRFVVCWAWITCGFERLGHLDSYDDDDGDGEVEVDRVQMHAGALDRSLFWALAARNGALFSKWREASMPQAVIFCHGLFWWREAGV